MWIRGCLCFCPGGVCLGARGLEGGGGGGSLSGMGVLSGGNGRSRRGGCHFPRTNYFPNCLPKLHENEIIGTPRGGGARPWRPLDPPMGSLCDRDPRGQTPPLPVDRITDRCKNMTLPQTSFCGRQQGSSKVIFDRIKLLSSYCISFRIRSE